jgi:hypothetical protein
MLLYVYRLRQSGIRVDRTTLRASGAMRGEFLFEPGAHAYWGKVPMYARLYAPGTTQDLLPYLEHARIVRVRQALLVMGQEVVLRATKDKGQRYRQTWVCSVERIAAEHWPAPPRRGTGFDPADDDAVDPMPGAADGPCAS